MSVRAPIEPPRPGGYPSSPGGPPPSGDGGRGLWPVVLVLVALAGAIALVAGAIVFTRGDSAEEQVPLGGPVPPATSAPAAAPTTADPQAATKAEIIAAYRGAWDAQLAVGRDPKATPDDNRLRTYLTGDSLVAIQLSMVKFKARNEVYTGEIKLNPTVIEISGESATIRDCVDDATGSADAETGEVVEPPTRVVGTAIIAMKLVGGTWKQANYRDEKVPCTSAAS